MADYIGELSTVVELYKKQFQVILFFFPGSSGNGDLEKDGFNFFLYTYIF